MLKRRSPEQDFQKSVAQFLALSLQAPTVWSAIGHGGGGRTRGAILKSMGVRKGMPDVLVMHPADAKHTIVLGLELSALAGVVASGLAAGFPDGSLWWVRLLIFVAIIAPLGVYCSVRWPDAGEAGR